MQINNNAPPCLSVRFVQAIKIGKVAKEEKFKKIVKTAVDLLPNQILQPRKQYYIIVPNESADLKIESGPIVERERQPYAQHSIFKIETMQTKSKPSILVFSWQGCKKSLRVLVEKNSSPKSTIEEEDVVVPCISESPEDMCVFN